MATSDIVDGAGQASLIQEEPVPTPGENDLPASPAAAEAAPAGSPPPPENTAPPVPNQPAPYDFREPSLLTTGELRKLRLRHDEFARSLATRLSIYLRLEFGLQIAELQTLTYRRFVGTLPIPTHLTLVQVEAMSGIGVLETSPCLGLTIVDRLLGGPGNAVSVQRDLTEIEVALLDQAVQIVIKEWCQHVAHQPEARTSFSGHETNGRFLQTSAPETPMLVLTLEARLNDCAGQMHLAFPYPMLEPILRQLAPLAEPNPPEPQAPTPTPVKWNPGLNEVLVPLSAEWPDLPITVRQLTQLKVGDVLPVDPGLAQNVQVRLARIPKFVGRLGTRGHQWAVELTRTIKR